MAETKYRTISEYGAGHVKMVVSKNEAGWVSYHLERRCYAKGEWKATTYFRTSDLEEVKHAVELAISDGQGNGAAKEGA